MKKLFILLTCIALIFSQFAQAQHLKTKKTPQELYDFHMKESRANKTWAWIVVGTGVGVMVTGLSIASDSSLYEENDSTEGLVLSTIGSLSTLISIPLFIAGAKHKKKAKLQLKNGAISFNSEMKGTSVVVTISF